MSDRLNKEIRRRIRHLSRYAQQAGNHRTISEGNYARHEVLKAQRASVAECDAKLREIPDDTRSLTARICGDPLPGRSALDQERLGIGP